MGYAFLSTMIGGTILVAGFMGALTGHPANPGLCIAAGFTLALFLRPRRG